MARVRNAPSSRARRKKVLKMAKGYFGTRKNLYKTARESVNRALCFAYRDRKVRKRFFRRLWNTRINAALRPQGLKYSDFIGTLNKLQIGLNRKVLADLALNEKQVFDHLVEVIKKN
ncbi:50S ribosomal protein L20 [Chlamydiota bacterium]